MTDNTHTHDDLHHTLENPLFQAVEQVSGLLSISKKSSPKSSQINQEIHDYETMIIKKRGSMPHR